WVGELCRPNHSLSKSDKLSDMQRAVADGKRAKTHDLTPACDPCGPLSNAAAALEQGKVYEDLASPRRRCEGFWPRPVLTFLGTMTEARSLSGALDFAKGSRESLDKNRGLGWATISRKREPGRPRGPSGGSFCQG